MSEPDWAVLLSIIYNQTGETKFKTDSEREMIPMILSEKGSANFESIPFEQDELKETVDYLDRMDLVDVRAAGSDREEIDEWLKSVSLAKKGFDVAHEREQEKTQHQNNRNVLLFTIILAFSALLQTFADLMSLQGLEFIAMALIFLTSNIIIVAIFYSETR